MQTYDEHSYPVPRRLLDAVDIGILQKIHDSFEGLTGHPIAFLDEDDRVVLPASSHWEPMLVIERSLDALRRHVGDRTKLEWPVSDRCTITRRVYGSFLVEYRVPIALEGQPLGAMVAYGQPARGMLSRKEEILDVDSQPAFARAIESAANLPALGESRAASLLPGLVGLFESILEYGLRARAFEDSFNRTLSLHRASQFLTSTLDLSEMLGQIVHLAAETLQVRACSIRLLSESGRTLKIAAVCNLSQDYLGKGEVEVAGSLIDQEALAGRSVVVYDVGKDPRIQYPREMLTEGLASLMCVPLRVKEQSIGVLRAYSAEHLRFSPTDVRIFEALGNQAAVAIESARLFSAAKESERQKHELDFAARIQAGLLPQVMPRKKGFEFAAFTSPHYEVGGDFFDFVEVQDDHMGLVIGDGSGKGVPAALLIASAHSALEVQIETTFRTQDIVERLNRFLCQRVAATGSFVTLFYGALDLRGRALTYTVAGHPLPMLARRGEVRELPGEGIVLGVNPRALFRERQYALERGDVLVLYTDGVVDAVNVDETPFGEAGLKQAILENCALDAQNLAAAIYRRVLEYAGEMSLNDDFTLTVTKVL